MEIKMKETQGAQRLHYKAWGEKMDLFSNDFKRLSMYSTKSSMKFKEVKYNESHT